MFQAWILLFWSLLLFSFCLSLKQRKGWCEKILTLHSSPTPSTNPQQQLHLFEEENNQIHELSTISPVLLSTIEAVFASRPCEKASVFKALETTERLQQKNNSAINYDLWLLLSNALESSESRTELMATLLLSLTKEGEYEHAVKLCDISSVHDDLSIFIDVMGAFQSIDPYAANTLIYEILRTHIEVENERKLLHWSRQFASIPGAFLPAEMFEHLISTYQEKQDLNCLSEVLPYLVLLETRYWMTFGEAKVQSIHTRCSNKDKDHPSLFSALSIVSRLLDRNRTDDSLALLKYYVHPIQWPYTRLITTLAANNMIYESLFVLEMYQEWHGSGFLESFNKSMLTKILQLHSIPEDEESRTAVHEIRKIVKNLVDGPLIQTTLNSVYENGSKSILYLQPNDLPSNWSSILMNAETSTWGDKRVKLKPDNNEYSSLLSITHEDSLSLDELYGYLLEELPRSLNLPDDLGVNLYDNDFDKMSTIMNRSKNTALRIASPKSRNTSVSGKWNDPESPENLAKFMQDLESLGNPRLNGWDPSRLMHELDNGKVSRKVLVSGVKKSWKKSIRSRQR